MTRAISFSRPMTGSSFPLRAASVRSRVNSARAPPFLPSSRAGAAEPLPAAAAARGSTRMAMLLPSRSRPISRCSVPI